MATVFSIINNKGGTGKTTTALNLGAAFVKKKKRVLYIDLDGQANLTASLGFSNVEHHVGELMLNSLTYTDASLSKDKYSDLLPSNDKIVDFENQINNEPGREFLLREIIEPVKNKYDYILIDCAPNLGILSTNSLVAADYFIVPMQAENFAFIGLDRILQISEKVKKRLNPKLEMGGILFIQLSHRTRFSQAVITNISLNDKTNHKLFETYIRRDIALMESAAFGQSIFEYAHKSRGAQDYNDFALEILKKYGKN